MPQMSKEVARITSQEPFTLTMSRPNSNIERIGIRNEYPETPLARKLFKCFGLMFLVSTYLPRKITTDFFIPEGFRNLISSMYEAEGREGPIFGLTDRKLARGYESLNISADTDKSRAVLTYSGGKDSMWNLNWLLKEKGEKNVLAVHFKRLNPPAAKGEYEATLKQKENIGFKLREVDLLNSSKLSGRNIMRSRNMFLVGLTIPIALDFGAGNIFLEGVHLPKETPKEMPFTKFPASWEIFNKLLADLGIPTQAIWRDSNAIQNVKDLLTERPEWLKLVHNCFAPANHKPERREKWQKVAPTFPLFDSQCGSCVKCREVNIVRILHDPVIQKANPKDVRAYLKDTLIWARNRKKDLFDFLNGNFEQELGILSQKYDLESFYQKYLNA